MIRTSKHNISDTTNRGKLEYLDFLFIDYKHDLILYIDAIINGDLPLKTYISSISLDSIKIKHSQYKQIIYKQASEIIRSQIKKANAKRYCIYKKLYKYFKENNRQLLFLNKKYSELTIKFVIKTKYFTMPNINRIVISLDARLFDIKDGNSFNKMIKLRLPYFNEKGTRALSIKIPLKFHKQSNKLSNNGFKLRNTIQLKKYNDNIYINLIWEKEVILKNEGTSLGIDVGYSKLISTSDNQILGEDMVCIYHKIVNKKKNSRAYKRALLERDNAINFYVNQLDLDNVKTLYVEDLNNVKYKSKYNNKVNDLMARWTYRPLLDRIEMICEVKGIKLVKVSPYYTSQTCSSCGAVHEESRNGQYFKCIDCGYEIDADYNAAININNKGAYSPLDQKAV